MVYWEQVAWKGVQVAFLGPNKQVSSGRGEVLQGFLRVRLVVPYSAAFYRVLQKCCQ